MLTHCCRKTNNVGLMHYGFSMTVFKGKAKLGNRGRSPGLVVIGGDSCSNGRESESRHRILDGHFSHLLVVRIVMIVCKDKNKLKRGRVWHIV